jgi:valyl-tRNA synthetase
VVDKQAEVSKLSKEIDRLTTDIASKQKRLADKSFRQKAPPAVVENLSKTLAQRQLEHKKLLERLAQLE